jgi:SAM-dependent methyltransferase
MRDLGSQLGSALRGLMPGKGREQVLFSNTGYCAVCMAETVFEARGEWLRDRYLCRRCGSIPRQRALVHVLKQLRPEWASAAVHESSPSLDFFARRCPGYSYSFFLEGVPPGSMSGDKRCEDLERLTFPDGSFDIFITQDVLEHVFRPERALAEIMRVLRDGGLHLFTAPKHKHLLASRQRAALSAGSIEHLLPAEYHGSPVGDGRALVTWDYGADFEDLVKSWCGYLTSTYVIRDRRLGIDGEYLEVFATVKVADNRANPLSATA